MLEIENLTEDLDFDYSTLPSRNQKLLPDSFHQGYTTTTNSINEGKSIDEKPLLFGPKFIKTCCSSLESIHEVLKSNLSSSINQNHGGDVQKSFSNLMTP